MIYKESLELESDKGRVTYINITEDLRQVIERSRVTNGIVSIISPHTTCSVFFEEYSHDITDDGDEFLQVDLNSVLEKIIPVHSDSSSYFYPGEKHYAAVESWPNAGDYLPNGDRRSLWNGDAHLKASLIGSSVALDLTEGKLVIGSTGSVYFVDFDQTRSRKRLCLITIIGE